jgi:hypothetical protein
MPWYASCVVDFLLRSVANSRKYVTETSDRFTQVCEAFGGFPPKPCCKGCGFQGRFRKVLRGLQINYANLQTFPPRGSSFVHTYTIECIWLLEMMRGKYINQCSV